MIKENTRRRLRSAIFLIEQTKKSKISNNEKSSYYRTSSVLLLTIVESLTYEIVKKLTSNTGYIFMSKTEHKERHKVPAVIFGLTNDLFLCEKTKKDILITDDGVTFGNLIIYLKNHSHIKNKEYKLLDWARKERNKIHLQGLTTKDTGYNRSKIEKISKIIVFLTSKLESFN